MVGLGIIQGWLRVSLGVGLGIILSWFKVCVGLVSGFLMVGSVVSFWLVQGWFGIYVGLVCGERNFAQDLFRVGSCLFDKYSLGFTNIQPRIQQIGKQSIHGASRSTFTGLTYWLFATGLFSGNQVWLAGKTAGRRNEVTEGAFQQTMSTRG